MEEQDFYEKTITRKSIFKGHVIEVAVDEVELVDGTRATRELVFHQGAVAILALTADKKIVLVKLFRKALERAIIEIPAGKIESNETSPLQTAYRELEEETALRPASMKPIFEFALSPGFSNEKMVIYLATDLSEIEHPAAQDEDERLELIYATLEEAKNMIETKEIYDSKTIMAIQYWELLTIRREEDLEGGKKRTNTDAE